MYIYPFRPRRAPVSYHSCFTGVVLFREVDARTRIVRMAPPVRGDRVRSIIVSAPPAKVRGEERSAKIASYLVYRTKCVRVEYGEQ